METVICSGCTSKLYPGETCPICAAFSRMRALWLKRKGRGKFIGKSQPKERYAD